MTPPAIQPPRKRTTLIVCSAGLVILAVSAGVIAWASRDPDRARAEKYLRQNLADPTFEVVRWWPAVVTNDRNAWFAKNFGDRADDLGHNPGLQNQAREEAAKWMARPPDRVCRIRYRTKSGSEYELRDTMLVLGESISDIKLDSDLKYLFPE